jgi:predicted Zn finger-like uncharacterized protein
VIVTCQNCDTRFNLDENLIKESGSKVRCSRCLHIFTVHKVVPVEEPDSALEETHADLLDTAEAPLPPLEAEQAPEEAAKVSEEAPEEVFDFDLLEAEEEPGEEEISLEALGLEEGLAAEEPTLVEDEITIEGTPEAVAAEPLIEEAWTKAEPKREASDTVSVESLEGAEEEAEQLEEELMPPLVAEKEPRARKRVSTPLIIVLVLVLLAGGAFAAYGLLKSLDIKIPFLESLIGAPESASIDPGNLRITTLEEVIKTEFVENKTDGRLFVIKGKVRNDYAEVRNFIMVRGVLYSQDGKAVQEKTVYCGNTLSDADLQALDKATMHTRLRNRFGDEKSNFRVPSGKVIPFVVVFSDLSQDLGEFSVEVVSSTPG